MKKKPAPRKRATTKDMPGKGTVWFTALVYANDAAVEQEVRNQLASYGITTQKQLSVVAIGEQVWMQLFAEKYPGIKRTIFECRNSAVFTNPTVFGLMVCHALNNVEKLAGALDEQLLYSIICGYALVWEAALEIDKAADEEKQRLVRRKGTDTTKAKADQRRALVQRLFEAAAKSGNLDVGDIARQARCSTDTVYRYVRESSRKRSR